MTTRRAFATTLLVFSATVAGAVTTLVPPAGERSRPASGIRQGNPAAPVAEVLRAQRVVARPAPLPPPALLVRDDEAGTSKPIVLEQARYEVTITGLSARTRATFVFRNDLARVLEGELVFPLPEGAVVSGYGLDVGGQIVDGVVVEAQQARVAFETETRRRIDPGLVEWVRGNNFRTRVWPIPAQGRRTVAVEYLSDLVTSQADGRAEAIYELPLRFTAPLEELALAVEVVRGTVEPRVRSGLENFTFSRWEDRYVAKTTRRDVQPGENLRVALPEVPRGSAIAETNDRGETFFVVDDVPGHPADASVAAIAAQRIGIVWDASLSRCEADRDRDLTLLASHLARLGDVEAQVLVFRDVPADVRRFAIRGGDGSALVADLRGQPCDGATNLAAVRFPEDVAYTLLFSDGLWTIGGSTTRWPSRPTYVLSGDPRADHGLLRALAERSGGAYFNLQRHRDADVLEGLGRPVFSLLGVDVDPAQVADLEPAGAQAVTGGRVRLAGRLLTHEARLTLRYGVPGQAPAEVRTVVVRRQPEASTGLVERAWAQQRIAALAIDAEGNRDDLVRIGQRFSLVTPGTSLLVLETLEQYLAHDVTPPATQPQLRAAFLARRRDEGQAQVVKRAGKADRVAAMWERRVEWWERRFSYDAGFRYVDPQRRADESVPVGGNARLGGITEEAAQRRVASAPRAAEPMAPPPAAVADSVNAQASARPVDASRSSLARETKAETEPDGPRIIIQPWNPDTPYLRSLEKASAADGYRVYLAERDTYGTSPAFYLDCADFFFRKSQRDLGLRVLTNVAELRLEDARLLRVLAHRLEQVDALDLAVELFGHVRRLRPEEPQSHRDLALALDRRAGTRQPAGKQISPESTADYRRALALLADIVEGEWDDRFPEIEVTALVEANRIASVLERGGAPSPWPLDARLRKLLDLDVRIVLTWDTDQTDMDLWIVEPSGERCFYSHPLTTIGGAISRDFTGGYGPEDYGVRRALAGEYAVKANFFGSRSQSLTGPTTVQATVITDYGRPTEARRAITVRLTSASDVVDIGEVTFRRADGSK